MREKTLCPLVLVSSVLWLGASFVHYSPFFFGTTAKIPVFHLAREQLSFLMNCFCHRIERKDLVEMNFLISLKWSASGQTAASNKLKKKRLASHIISFLDLVCLHSPTI